MLNFKIRNIIGYIDKSGVDLTRAAKEFFGTRTVSPTIPNQESISSLFNEWLAFDYRLPNGATVATQYYLKNPDHLSTALLHELQEIIQTQKYDLFEVEATNPGVWVDVWGMASGQRYHVVEKTFSAELKGKIGCFYNRIANVNGDYYFIGSNPFLLPMTHTDRSRAFFRTSTNRALSPKDALPLLFVTGNTKRSEFAVSLTPRTINTKRKTIEKLFGELAKKYKLATPFSALVNFVYNESYQDHFADFYKDIIEKGIPERMITDNLPFFQDLWNFFPHKKLNCACPAEKYREAYG